MSITATSAAEQNSAYYDALPPGQQDYWNRMAAPLFRADTLCRLALEANPSTVVDLGCGNGRLLSEMARRGFAGRLFGIDLAPKQIEMNRASLPGMTWLDANLNEDATFPKEWSGAFDVVTATELIEHLDDPATLLRNARKLAKPGEGLLLLSTQSGRVGPTERFVGHQRHFEVSDMKSLLAANGWESVRVWNAGFPFHDLSKWIAGLRPQTMIARFSDQKYGPFENFVCWSLRVLFKLNSDSRGAQLFAVARATRD